MDGNDDSNGFSFWFKVKVIPIVGHIYYDGELKVCNHLEFKLIMY